MGARAFYRGAAAMAAISLMLPAAAPAQTSKAGVVTTLQGTATVARSSAPEPAPLKFKDDVFVQDRITTGEESIARILLGGKAVVTIRERSNLTITETATSSTIEMTSGKIALSVDKSRVKPGESVEIKTPNAVAAIRGTIIIAEVDPPTPASPDTSTRFTLLTGVVDVTRIDQTTGRLTGAPVILKPLQALGVSGVAPLGMARPITRVEADAVAAGFAAPLREPSPSANSKVVDDQVQEASKRTAVVDSKDKDKDKSDTAGRGNNGKGKDDGSASAGTSSGTGSSAGSASSGGSTGGTSSAGSSGSAGSAVAGTSGAPVVGGSSAGLGSAAGTGAASGGGASATSGGSAASAGDVGRVVAIGGNTLGSSNGTGAKTGVPGGLVTGGGGSVGGVGIIGGDDLRGRDKTPKKDRTR